MAEISFTEKQREVIEARDSSVLVSAAAGSGKTAVLVQRVIEKLLDPTHPQDISRLLIVTFTNAAAAQMKERIGKRLSELLLQKEYEGNVHLQKQALLLRNAPITTIHGFCLSLLREFFYELDLDPSFRIADEGELTLLSADVMEDLLENYYSEEDSERQELFLRLTECMGSGKNDDALVEAIEKITKFAQSAPFPESFLRQATEHLDRLAKATTVPDDDPCLLMMAEQIRMLSEEWLSDAQQTLTFCMGKGGPLSYREAIEDDIAFLEALVKAKDYGNIRKILDEHPKFAKLSTKKCETTEEAKDHAKKMREGYKKGVDSLQKDFFFADREQMAEDMAAMAPLGKLLLDLCKEYMERYASAKTERGLVDFSDLEHLTVRLLIEEAPEGYKTTETAKQIRARFDEIMVDECQDSNRIQDLLTYSISGEEDGTPNRFMVGDVKQSIYKFRMAMPELFMQKYEEYKEEGPYRKIILGRNFRSRAAVVDYVNSVFTVIMRKSFGGIEYDDAAKLYCYADYPKDLPENRTELILTELETEDSEDESTEKIQKEAYSVGGRIQKMIRDGFKITDGEEILPSGEKGKKYRPVNYGDITILFRAMSGYAEPFSEVFAELGIPVIAETQTGYFKAQEVCVALNALRIIDNPYQDLPLVSVLHSEMVGMTEEELAMVRVVTKREKGEEQISFFEAIKEFLSVTEEEDVHAETVVPAMVSAREKLSVFLEHYGRLREMSAYAGVPELLKELFLLTAYPDHMRVKQGGERRTENLRMLIEKAKAFEETSYSGIFDFIRYIERLIRYEIDSGEAQTAAGENAVHLMSIHKSKGLEAPVVIVAGLAKQFNFRDVYAEVVLHERLGIGMKYRDEVLRVEAPTLYKKVIADSLKRDMLAEELRVLYVALTRAKEKLILSATVKTMADFFEKAQKADVGGTWAKITTLTGARSYLDFLMPTFLFDEQQGVLEIRVGTDVRNITGDAVTEQEEKRTQRMQRLSELCQKDCTEEYDAELAGELEKRASFVYPYPMYSGKRKLSVSELKKAAYAEEEQEELFPEKTAEKILPKFLCEADEEEQTISGSERGTLYHKIMECMDFCKEYDSVGAVEEELNRLIGLGRVREDAKQLVAPEKIHRFFQSELAGRMQKAARAGKLRKEQPFVIGILYDEVYGNVKTDGQEQTVPEYIMVQGIIDACFEENDELVLVDYKTDSVKRDVREELTKRYRTQLDYYERALRQMTGKAVSDRMIYAFTSGEAFSVEKKKEEQKK